MKKYIKKNIVSVLILLSVNQLWAITVTISNNTKENVSFRIKNKTPKPWTKIKTNGKSKKIKIPTSIIIEWRDKNYIYESHPLMRPRTFSIKTGGRYEVIQRNWLLKPLKLLDDNYLYCFKRIPTHLGPVRKKYLLPLTAIKENIPKVKKAIAHYQKAIPKNKSLAKQYSDMVTGAKREKNKKQEQIAQLEKENAEKRVKAYTKHLKSLQKLEKELLIREIIEQYKQKINTLQAQLKQIKKLKLQKKNEKITGLERKIKEYKNNLYMHKAMYKELTGKELPKDYMPASYLVF